MLTCIIAILWVASFIAGLYRAVNGWKATEPSGFTGVLICIAMNALVLAAYVGAGAFSLLRPSSGTAADGNA